MNTFGSFLILEGMLLRGMFLRPAKSAMGSILLMMTTPPIITLHGIAIPSSHVLLRCGAFLRLLPMLLLLKETAQSIPPAERDSCSLPSYARLRLIDKFINRFMKTSVLPFILCLLVP